MGQLFSRPLAILAFVIIAALPRGAAAQTGRVAGIVNDEAGHPIRAATVTAEDPNSGQTFTATTDEKGRFSMIGLRNGTWTFIAQAPGYAPEAGKMAVRVGSPNPAIAFELIRRGVLMGPLGSVSSKELQVELSAADALFSQQKWDEAIAAYHIISEKAPVLGVVNLQIAAAHRNKHEYDQAIAAYNDVLKNSPNNQQALIGIAATNLERGNSQMAEDTLLKAAETPSAGRDVFYNLGDIKLSRGDAEGAAKWFQKASEADPYWGKPLYQLAVNALKKGDGSAAATLMERVVSVDPESAEAALARSALEELKK
jgi:Flp pilus assembly protein TadD